MRHNLAASTSTAAAVSFFAFFWIILIAGFGIHWLIDRHQHGHRPHRAVELGLLWVVAFGGLWALLGGISHISGQSHQLATSIGYAPSMSSGKSAGPISRSGSWAWPACGNPCGVSG